MRPVSFLTGASSGIGRALAPLLATEGHAVALVARRQAQLEELAQSINEQGGRALPLVCDVCDFSSVQAAIWRCEEELGPVDRLILNAGTGRPSPATRFRASDIEAAMAVNYIGPAYCIEAVLPGMLQRGGGHIVGIGSPGGWRGIPGSGAYGASKAALANLLESLRVELAPHQIAVTTIEPGFVRTEMTDQNKFHMPFLLEADDAARRIHRAIVARRRTYAFPWQLIWPLKLLRLLPPALYDRVIARTARE